MIANLVGWVVVGASESSCYLILWDGGSTMKRFGTASEFCRAGEKTLDRIPFDRREAQAIAEAWLAAEPW